MTFEEIMAEELGEAVGIDEVIDDTNVDSLSYLKFIQELEKQFMLTLPDEEIAKVQTFRQLKMLVENSKATIQ